MQETAYSAFGMVKVIERSVLRIIIIEKRECKLFFFLKFGFFGYLK